MDPIASANVSVHDPPRLGSWNHVDLEKRIPTGLLQLVGSEARCQVETIIDGGCCSWQRMRSWRRTRSGRALGCPRDPAGDKPPWQIQRLDRHNALPAPHHQTERNTRLHFMIIERFGGSRNTYQFWKGAKTPNKPSENRRSAQGSSKLSLTYYNPKWAEMHTTKDVATGRWQATMQCSDSFTGLETSTACSLSVARCRLHLGSTRALEIVMYDGSMFKAQYSTILLREGSYKEQLCLPIYH